MEHKKRKLVIILSLVIIVFLGFLAARKLQHMVQYTREASAWVGVEIGLIVLLKEHYEEKKCYPGDLSSLDLSLCLMDGATEEMLKQIEYSSEGSACKYSFIREKAQVLVECTFDKGQYKTKTTPIASSPPN